MNYYEYQHFYYKYTDIGITIVKQRGVVRKPHGCFFVDLLNEKQH